MPNVFSPIGHSSSPQSGNIFVALFGTVALVGLLGGAAMVIMKGPVRSMSEVTRNTEVKNDMIAATALLSEASLAAQNADCDGDSMVEPIAYADPGSKPAPAGGGYIPASIGARKADPWGSPYGYCVWDHGSAAQHADCGGPSAGRRIGGNVSTADAIAIISAGADRIFQSTCVDWVDGSPSVVQPPDSDDVVRTIPYGQFLLPRMADAKIGPMPDAACQPENIGIMRIELGVVQVCMDTGWEEIGTSATADTNFIPVTDAALSSQHTSNELTFTGFMNKKNVIVSGNAVLFVNGVNRGASYNISANDMVALQASASGVPETTSTFSISVSGVRKTWTITTRDYHPASLSITPPTNTGMDVTGPGTPAYGAPSAFIVANGGEAATMPLSAAQLTNTTNFEVYEGGGGDTCQGVALPGGQSCIVDIRPKATDDGDYNATLTIGNGAQQVNASLSGTASGWTCNLPWGGTLPSGNSVDAYATNSVACGQTCAKEVRTCTSGALNGSYQYQSCSANCSYSWIQGSWSGCSASCGGGTRTRTVTCQRQDGQTVADSFCSGGKPATSESCNTQSCVSYSWNAGGWSTCGGACATKTSYNGTRTRTVNCRRNDGSTVSDSYCSGGKPAASETCSCGCTATIGEQCISQDRWNLPDCYSTPPKNHPSGPKTTQCITRTLAACKGTPTNAYACKAIGKRYCYGACGFD